MFTYCFPANLNINAIINSHVTSIATDLIAQGSGIFTAHHSPRTHQQTPPIAVVMSEPTDYQIFLSLFPLPHHLTLANGRGTTQPICTTSADCAIFTPFHLRACHEDRKNVK